MNRTTLERPSDRELLITRMFDGPPHLVFEAYTKPEFVRRWWGPKSRHVEIVSCDADVNSPRSFVWELGIGRWHREQT